MNYSLNSHAQPAIYYNQHCYSYQQLQVQVNYLADQWQGKVTAGDRIALMGSNSPSWVAAFFAAWKLKAVVVPIDPQSSVEEVTYILNDCQPRLFLCFEENSVKGSDALTELRESCSLIILSPIFDSLSTQVITNSQLSFFDSLDAPAIIIYTSGTTGGPKGVVLSYQNLLVNIRAVTSDIPIILASDRVLAMLPFHHIFPLAGTLLATMLTGASIVIPSSLSSDHLLQCLKQYPASLILAVPRFYSLIYHSMMKKINANLVGRLLFSLCRVLKSPALSRLIFAKAHQALGGRVRHLISGGAAIDPQVEQGLIDLGFSLLVGYGMTECAPMISFTRPKDIIKGSSGLPLPGVEVKIVDGEIWVKGDNVMQGYYHRAEATAQTMESGYLKTGDLGHTDSKGHLFVTGRKKEMIVLPSGKNINPEEIENKLLRTHPQIEDVAVTYYQKGLHAIIVPSQVKLSELGIHNLQEFFQVSVVDPYNAEVASYKRLLNFSLQTTPLPRTRLGKLRRHLLQVGVTTNAHEAAAIPLNSAEQRVFVKLAEQLQLLSSKPVMPGHHLEIDLSLDSLDKINLLAFVHNNWKIHIPEQQLAHLTRVDLLCQYIAEHASAASPVTSSAAELTTPEFKIDDQVGVLGLFSFLASFLFPRPFLKVRGRDYLPAVPSIFISNHLSYIDALLLIRILPYSILKNLYFGAKQKHLQSALATVFMRSAHIVPIDLNQDLAQAVDLMGQLLGQGKSILLFPEGTRSRTGELATFRRLFAVLAHEHQVPVTPIAIHGTDRYLPRNKLLPRLWQRIDCTILPPLFPQHKSVGELVTEAQSVIDNALKIANTR